MWILKVSVFVLLFSLGQYKSFGQCLMLEGDYYTLVDDSLSQKKLSDKLFISGVAKSGNFYDGSEFKELKLFNHSLIILMDDEYKWGIMDMNGQIIQEFDQWNMPYIFDNGIYSRDTAVPNNLELDNLVAFYNSKNEHLLTVASVFSEFRGYYLAMNTEGYVGILDSNLNWVLPCEFSSTSWDAKNFFFNERGYIALKNAEGKCGIVNYQGNTILNFEFDFIEDLSNDKNQIKKDNLFGIIDQEGNFLVEISFEELNYFYHQMRFSMAKKNDQWIIVDSELNQIGDYAFQNVIHPTIKNKNLIYELDSILFVETEKNQLGIFDLNNQRFLSTTFYDSLFSINTMLIGIGEMTVDIFDETGKLVKSFSKNDLSFSDDAGKLMQIYLSGITTFSANSTPVVMSLNAGKKGIMTLDGKIIIPELFDSIFYQGNGWFIVCHEEKYGVVDFTGNVLIPLNYQQVCDLKLTGPNWAIINGFEFIGLIDKDLFLINEKGEILKKRKLKKKINLCTAFEE